MSTQPKHGGARQGAGRQPLAKKGLQCTIPADTLERLKTFTWDARVPRSNGPLPPIANRRPTQGEVTAAALEIALEAQAPAARAQLLTVLEMIEDVTLASGEDVTLAYQLIARLIQPLPERVRIPTMREVSS